MLIYEYKNLSENKVIQFDTTERQKRFQTENVKSIKENIYNLKTPIFEFFSVIFDALKFVNNSICRIHNTSSNDYSYFSPFIVLIFSNKICIIFFIRNI